MTGRTAFSQCVYRHKNKQVSANNRSLSRDGLKTLERHTNTKNKSEKGATEMDSDDYTSEDSKRKRGEEDETFNRSKKTSRTPDKSQKNEGKLDHLISLVQSLITETKQIRADQQDMKNEIKKLREENEKILMENQVINAENKNIRQKNRELEDRLEMLEREKRKNNVIINGMKMDVEDKKVLKEVMENMFEKEMQIKVDVKAAHKLGERTCLIELEKEREKELIMNNKHKLKDLRSERIYINHDMTKMEREKAKEIRKTAKQEMEKGKKVKIGYNKIVVEGTSWRWNRNTEKLEISKN